jgi:hypothetical protein
MASKKTGQFGFFAIPIPAFPESEKESMAGNSRGSKTRRNRVDVAYIPA